MIGWTTHLTAGTHLAPEDGTCLMEAVSTVTGDRWTDAPSSTHPLLAHLARLVNDAVSDDLRDDLAAFIPDLIDTNSPDPLVNARLAEVCTSYALTVDDSPSLRRLRRSVQRHLREPWQPRTRSNVRLDAVRQWTFEHGTARRAVEASVAYCQKRGDDHLVGLLAAAVAVVHPRRRSSDASLTAG
jgi:hypothetical protein